MLGSGLCLYAMPATLLLFAGCLGSGRGGQGRVGAAPLQERRGGGSLALHAEPESEGAEMSRLKAEVEKAEALVAVAEAKAALAEAKAAALSPPAPTHGADEQAPAVAQTAPAALEAALESSYSGAEARPAQLFFSPQGAAFFEMLDRLEGVGIGGSQTITALDTILRSFFTCLYQFAIASKAGEFDNNAPEDVRQNVKELGGAISDDAIASALAPLDKGGDWRPICMALGNVDRLAEIMDDSLEWDRVFPEEFMTQSGLARGESRHRLLSFLRTPAFREAGTWTQNEVRAAEKLVADDPRLGKVFTRMNMVQRALGEQIRNAAIVPVAAILSLVVAIGFFCYGINKDPNLAGGTAAGTAPPTSSIDAKTLPLFKLEK